ncbi:MULTISPECIES: sugar ABC transporter ATP-binding protein [Peribacillus]|uniref:sugar ABC transporter ATP-binding protein n=1 Tax=Peribacillus TaxID=2675229 RepID=UPI001F4D7626|nr:MULTISPECIES: sugar ABC transporter ATP-binding protein [unclassified Peribacillus]MCK1985417.1 sugar ABC transporter ATP-binding protein [Peribacillus sp. Aquil_B1]MCK2007849.1 sugar ABC transporter ATP-binding protein [Peribacillus sp. Aquil_B8]
MGKQLEMKKISIEFPGVKALSDVDFSVKSGTAHALVGANGAGKSTLMKVLSGAHVHYSGDIFIDGMKRDIRSPKAAQEQGIQIVYQEVDTALIPYLTVGENVMLNDMVQNMGKKQMVQWKELHNTAASILEDMKIRVPSKKLVRDLTLAEKQMVLIARAVSTECKFLILDEPTAPLSHTETTELFRIVNELKQKGVGIIFISHRLPEIFEICEEITIMRNGERVTCRKTEDMTRTDVVESMLGKTMDEQFPEVNASIGDVILEVNGLSDAEKVKNVSLNIKAGEIIGLAGLVGAGKTELCKTLFGHTSITAGEVILNGRKLSLKSPHEAVKSGLALVPEERRKEGVLVQESVSANLTAASLGKFSKTFSFVNRQAEKERAKEMIASLGIKTPSGEVNVENLSGGNQQKVAIGKWLMADADVYIFDEPTKGVDVGAKKDIFELIAELARNGKAIIYASSELSEIIGITNRTYVLYDGSTVIELETSKTNEEELLFYSTGGK